nr:hypothetical protein [Acinetobacter sp. Marseille-Q1620]
MKYLTIFILISSLSITGCKASEKDETNAFLDNNFKTFLDDDRKLILASIKTIHIDPTVKEEIFDKIYIKVMTTKSLLDSQPKGWINGLDRKGFDYTTLDTLCWATNYLYDYLNNIDDAYKKRISQSTRNNVQNLYQAKQSIIQLRDRKKDAGADFVEKCK